MKNLKLVFGTTLFAIAFLIPRIAPAMTIDNFARLTMDDEASYVTFMVEGSAKMLRAEGKPDQAAKAVALFKDSSKNGGVNQFAMNLKTAYNRNNIKATNPNNRTPDLQVEDAMASTLKDNGIIVPVNFLLDLEQNFHPSGVRRPLILSQ